MARIFNELKSHPTQHIKWHKPSVFALFVSMLAIDMTTSPAAAIFEIALHTFISRSIHAMRKSTIPRCCSTGIGVPRGTFHQLARQLRQQQAQACCALNTGCPRIGVCFPSFGGFAGASRVRMKSAQWERIVSIPFSAMYFRSASERWKRLLNFDFANRTKAAS